MTRIILSRADGSYAESRLCASRSDAIVYGEYWAKLAGWTYVLVSQDL
jgi:hypothetical protein